MIIYYNSQQDMICGFERPNPYIESQFICDSYRIDMVEKHDSIKAFVPASCFIDNATWQIKTKDESIVYYEGTFEQYPQEPT